MGGGGGTVAVWDIAGEYKKIEQVFPERQIGLDQFMKTLSQKEKRGYTLSDDRGLI